MIDEKTGINPAPVATDAQPPIRQWYLIFVLTTIYALSFLDRNVLNLMVNPIKADLGITDVQMSLLIGLSFILLFTTFSIPFGYVADIFSRRLLLGGAVLFWSCMSATCGFAGSYWPLFFGRTGLGIGEAALQPAGFSLIRDSFPADKRARAFSIYQIGPVIGTSLATLIGGLLYGWSASGALQNVPILGALKPWQFAIAVPGLCGLPFAFLMLTIREPARSVVLARTDVPSFGDMFRYVWVHRRVYLTMSFATICIGMAGGGWSGWMAAAIGRSWDLAPNQIGKVMGPISLICTPTGYFIMGYIMDRMVRSGRRDGPVLVVRATQALHLLPALSILYMPNQTLMWIAYAISVSMSGGMQIVGAAIWSDITPPRLMGKTVAFFNGVQVLVGLTSGPTVYALVSQHFFTGKLAIVHAMTLCYAILISTALILLTKLGREVRDWHAVNTVQR